jgi:23S rRNA A1618 N6-methylase RlmF
MVSLLGSFGFTQMAIRNMSAELANSLVEQNAIEELMKLYAQSNEQQFLTLIIHLMTYQTTRNLNVTSLFKLS